MFAPTLPAAHERLASFQPDLYAASRNQIEGAVSGLSSYLTHGFLSLDEVFRSIDARHPLDSRHKFVFELGWRAYFRHVWRFLGDGIHRSIHDGPLADELYSQDMPHDVVAGCTGVPVIDASVRELYTTGYLHNHARMWLASYLVHVRKVHWHCGAQWLLSHLLDGDLASNHLSWQWVAGTSSVKPYLFNAENVAKFAPVGWHSLNTVIDVSYEEMKNIAYGTSLPEIVNESASGKPLREPTTTVRPINSVWSAPDGSLARGKKIWLLHPWSLGLAPDVSSGDALCIGVGLSECHAATPWDHLRWDFVTQGLNERVDHLWWGETELLANALEGAHSVHWQSEPHASPMLARLGALLEAVDRPGFVTVHQAPDLFEPVQDYCPSFSQWWRRTQLKR